MKARANLSGKEYRAMRKMLALLTPAERASLKDPDFITEDEADLIYCDRQPDEPTYSLDEVLAEAGIARRRTRA
ncbi:MAG: hypothetical protein M3N54_07510 [Acidobacteriota bacterium]|nr:hypothetical protein [Acidobacteriota bacterium]